MSNAHLAQARGMSPAVKRSIDESERNRATETVICAHCGSLIDFTPRDPQGLGRSMQRCTNSRCVDHLVRPLVQRHL